MNLIFALALALAFLPCAAKTVKVSDFGFDPDDSTEFLQRAFDSGARRVVIDRRSAPWTATSLDLKSNTEVVFEEGAELQAKKGAFTDRFATFITLKGVTNVQFVARGKGATVRMRKSDYLKAPYAMSEYRHAFNLLGAKDVKIENLDILESGGDGIYVGAYHAGGKWHDCENLSVRKCRIDGNNRQAISVISAKSLLVEDCGLMNTAGAAPMAGVDFEPNDPGQRLVDCVFRRCAITGNKTAGVFFATGNLKATTADPVSILFEDCDISGNGNENVNVSPSHTVRPEDAPRGLARFVRCRLDCSKGERALLLEKKIKSCFRVVFSDCTIIEPAREWKGRAAVELAASANGDPFADGFSFERLTVRQPWLREWCRTERENYSLVRPSDWKGSVKRVYPGGSKTEVLDGEWCRKMFPVAEDATLPRFAGDFSNVEIVDPCPGKMLPLSPVAVRMNGEFVFYAAKAGECSFVYRYARMKEYVNEHPRLKLSLSGIDGRKLADFPAHDCSPSPRRLTVKVPAAGFYRISSASSPYASIAFLESEAPLAIDTSRLRLEAVYCEAALRFYARAGERVGFFFSNDPGEMVNVRFADPAGRERWRLQDFSDVLYRCQSPEAERAGGFWRVDFTKSGKTRLRKFHFHLVGVAACLFPSGDRGWRFK